MHPSVMEASLAVNDFHLPLDRRAYVLHPCVAHTVPVRSVGAPVLGTGYRAGSRQH